MKKINEFVIGGAKITSQEYSKTTQFNNSFSSPIFLIASASLILLIMEYPKVYLSLPSHRQLEPKLVVCPCLVYESVFSTVDV